MKISISNVILSGVEIYYIEKNASTPLSVTHHHFDFHFERAVLNFK
jgi:hypothetical protein